MFYLMMHSTHFIYSYIRIIHMVKDHSDSKRKPMGYSFHLQGFFYMHHRTDRTFVTPVMEHWLEQEIAHGAMGCHGVDPLNYFSFQPVPQDWCNKGCGMCCLLDGAYKRTLAINQKE